MVSLLSVVLLVALSLTGCSNDKGGDSGLKAGQSAISLQLSGGHLSDALEFRGTVDKTMMVFSSSMIFLGRGLDITGSNATAVFEQLILSLESSAAGTYPVKDVDIDRSEEHTSELQSRPHLVCRLLLEKKKKKTCK